MVSYLSIVGALAALIVLFGVRAASVNRLIRRRLGFSLVLCGGVLALVVVDWGVDLKADLPSIAKTLMLLAGINALVAVLVNPLRADRVPDRFPTIVQDAITIGLFLIVGTAVIGEKWLALSAVGGFVIGFALQDTLGNMFAGLAIQVEKPFRSGQWISVGGHEGLVAEITWRATRLLTKAGNYVIVPNNVISKEAIVNFSEPAAPTRLMVEVGVTYDAPPNEVKAVLLQTIVALELVRKEPEPVVLVADFAASSIVYRVKFWIDHYTDDDRARDQVRTAIYYALKRAGIDIPYPIQVQYEAQWPSMAPDMRANRLQPVLRGVDVFASLPAEDRADLIAACAERLYGAGEAIVRQGEPGDSMFVLCRGEVRVTLEPDGIEVARIGTGGYFGEMSLLTGEPRTATVTAVTDCDVFEITADSFRRLARIHPEVVEQISIAVEGRRRGLQRSREAAAAVEDVPEVQRGFLARVQTFLGFGR